MSQCRTALARTLSRHRGNGFAHNFGRVFRVLHQHGDDLIHGYRIVMRVPAIVIRDHRDRDVTNFRFARQLCLLQIGHADHIHAQPAIHIRLGFRGELRTLHAQIGSAMPAGDADLLARRLDHSPQVLHIQDRQKRCAPPLLRRKRYRCDGGCGRRTDRELQNPEACALPLVILRRKPK